MNVFVSIWPRSLCHVSGDSQNGTQMNIQNCAPKAACNRMASTATITETTVLSASGWKYNARTEDLTSTTKIKINALIMSGHTLIKNVVMNIDLMLILFFSFLTYRYSHTLSYYRYEDRYRYIIIYIYIYKRILLSRYIHCCCCGFHTCRSIYERMMSSFLGQYVQSCCFVKYIYVCLLREEWCNQSFGVHA